MDIRRIAKEAGEEFSIKIKDLTIGNGNFLVIAGPCSVENNEMIIETAGFVKSIGADMLRGGAFKPRTSPYSFQGLKEEGLKMLKEASEKENIPVVSEVMDPRDIEIIYPYIDMFQIGSRNMQNFSLLTEVGKTDKPVMLKRGMAATIEDFLLAAEYIAAEGNDRIVLCERGIRTFESYTRNTLDLAAVPILKKLSKLPVIVDPSHGTGMRDLILPMSLAAMAAGADGLMVEVHPEPACALSDAEQSLSFEEFERLIDKVKETKDFFMDMRKGRA
ncbi:MAG: phospho-2-dehydro-3-deoxyheptonate aldolase [Clostridia bacterium]|jgi:3-deoxy-7-phosphoheptulonate synthase|nr:phospho-2-dehydro-3-deoxyheptonate aldolase [Clostridia bacterium]